MKGLLSLAGAATRESCTVDDLLRLGSSGALPIYADGNEFTLWPDFFATPYTPALAIPLTGLFAFDYSGPIRLSAEAISIIREKGSAPTIGPQTFYYLEDHNRQNFTPNIGLTHPFYRDLPPDSYDFFYSKKPLFVCLKGRLPRARTHIGISTIASQALVSVTDVQRALSPPDNSQNKRTFEDAIIGIARLRLKNHPDLFDSFIHHMVSNPASFTDGIFRWEFEFSRQQSLTSSLTPPEKDIIKRNEFITKKVDAWMHEHEEEHGQRFIISPHEKEQQYAPHIHQPAPLNDWKHNAREIGERIYSANPSLTLEAIAEQVRQEMKNKNITGQRGWFVSASTIRREALAGLTTTPRKR
ncbi:MAG: hypothetical protein GY938_27915 [Ketobacter sp.]|nr:hypothetical protein [Ketobacter sp.]